jgi:hypothetical protein
MRNILPEFTLSLAEGVEMTNAATWRFGASKSPFWIATCHRKVARATKTFKDIIRSRGGVETRPDTFLRKRKLVRLITLIRRNDLF